MDDSPMLEDGPLTEEDETIAAAIEPLTYQVLVRPLAVEERSKGGLLLPEQARRNEQLLTVVGKVIAMGPLCFNDPAKFGENTPFDVGDWVIYGAYAGKRITLANGETVILLDDDAIQCRVNDLSLVKRS